MEHFQLFHQFLATSWLALAYFSIMLGMFAYLMNETEWSSCDARPGVRFSRTRSAIMRLFVGLVLGVLAVLWPAVIAFYFIDKGM